MDVNKDSQGERHLSVDDKLDTAQSDPPPLAHPSEHFARRHSGSISSLDSRVSALATDTDEPSDMDSSGDAYRRRRAQMMAGLENGDAMRQNRKNRSRRKGRHASDAVDDKHTVYSSDDGHISDFSSPSTSDDVELSHMMSGDALTDDEETGLTSKDKEHRKRKRRRHTRVDGRIAGVPKSSKEEQKAADRNVVKAMIINVLLIISWYIFSLSISIVSGLLITEPAHANATLVQQMDVLQGSS